MSDPRGDGARAPDAGAIGAFDVATLTALIVAVSLWIGGPIRISPWRELPLSPVTATVIATGLLLYRNRLRPSLSWWAAMRARVTVMWRDRSVRVALRLVVLARVALLATGLAAIAVLGRASAPDAPFDAVHELRNLPDRWDASWYLGIAAGGYRWEGTGQRYSRLAFFPAYPMAVRGVGRTLHLPQSMLPWLWTGVIVSTIFFVAAVAQLHRLMTRLFDAVAADRAAAIAVLYPYSVFHGQMYTESLFLLCCVAATLAVHERRFGKAVCFGLVAGLTRPIGCLAALPVLGALCWRRRDGATLRIERRGIAALAAPFIGTGLYSLYVWWLTGDPLGWFRDQAGWGRGVVNPMHVLATMAEQLIAGGWRYVAADWYQLLNLAFGVAAVVIALRRHRAIGWPAVAFVVSGVAVPFWIGGVASMGRYTCVLFPIFVALALTTRRRFVWMAVVSALLQVALAAAFYTDRPVF